MPVYTLPPSVMVRRITTPEPGLFVYGLPLSLYPIEPATILVVELGFVLVEWPKREHVYGTPPRQWLLRGWFDFPYVHMESTV